MIEAKKVWVCVQYSQAGTDMSVHETEASSNAHELALMVEGLADVEDPEARLAIVQEILAEQYAKAFMLYAEATEESFETLSRDIASTSREQALAKMANYVDDADFERELRDAASLTDSAVADAHADDGDDDA